MGFDVTKEYDVQDLTEVKADKSLLPVSKGLKVRVAKAGPQTNKNENIYSLKLELRIVDGIQNAEGVAQYINKPLFTGVMDLVYGADMTVDGRENNKWWKGNQHLVEFKNFCKALDLPLAELKINDEFFANLISKEVLVDVVHEAETVNDPTGAVKDNGKPKQVPTGEFREKLKNWRKVS